MVRVSPRPTGWRSRASPGGSGYRDRLRLGPDQLGASRNRRGRLGWVDQRGRVLLKHFRASPIWPCITHRAGLAAVLVIPAQSYLYIGKVALGLEHPLIAIIGGAVVGVALLCAGLAIAALAFGTSFAERLMTPGRPGPTQMVVGALAWSLALIAPAAFVIIGLARLGSVVERLALTRPQRAHVEAFARNLSDDFVVATKVRLSDGYVIPELVVGPHGVAIFETLPPPSYIRYVGGKWEVRVGRRRWLPTENPLERAARDAERVRRWIAAEDRDFVVKVYAALVVPDNRIQRTSACAVITRDQVPAYLASLPPQRSLTPSRREFIVEQVRESV